MRSLGNKVWLTGNLPKVHELFPETWTHSGNINWLGVFFKMKVIGVDFRTEDEKAKVLTFLTKVGVIEYRQLGDDVAQIRRAPGFEVSQQGAGGGDE